VAVFLELVKFASLLLSIVSLDAVFHSAFLEPGSNLHQRLVPSLYMLLLSCAICLASGYIFNIWEERIGRPHHTVARSLPMMIFWWATGGMVLLFGLAWILERYYLGLWL
jgi:hypothetical protein